MAITTYSELQSAVASWLHRTDLTTQIPDFIALCEADLQVRANLDSFEASASVTITSGSGTLPSDFTQAYSAVFGTQTDSLQYIQPSQYDEFNARYGAGEPAYYTTFSNTLKITPTQDGTVALSYMAGFTALSSTNTSNSILTLFPDAYLYGSLAQACIWTNDDVGLKRYGVLYAGPNFPSADARGGVINRIRKYMLDRKYPQGLQMRAN